MKALVAVLALLATGAGAEEDRSGLVSDFGRYADSSRTRAEAAAVPLGAAFAAPKAGPAADLSRAVPAQHVAVVSAVPAPSRIPNSTDRLTPAQAKVPRLGAAAERPASGVTATGLALVAAGGLLLLALKPEKAEVPYPAAESWTPPPTWKREWPRADGPIPLPPLRLPEPPLPPMPQAWWGITDAEQNAIARWNMSPEKRWQYMPLDRWLEAHRGELPGVDVPSLKEKLRRDA